MSQFLTVIAVAQLVLGGGLYFAGNARRRFKARLRCVAGMLLGGYFLTIGFRDHASSASPWILTAGAILLVGFGAALAVFHIKRPSRTAAAKADQTSA